ncbi:DNA-binding protein [Paraburkholderia silvatlantica]|uniref:Myosin heavy subunit n=1 Tax=Paraburkholderia silvatlantica TaxID=321895 RepID=A0ABR6FW20_9BURK|nr:DNA-binding protein [Paraburkholderia silvatlantica]MBB2931640.1 myosin heavy subunit [Paraburkholderia silvatlantica]PVY26569.1 plasmid replication DNA-binding protein KfrA [Paraburkholderia silvatlantica]PXW32834.1 plasmid replication DNA-binding protein KfrA [Paraburkholderia silvatlantica]
MSSSITITDELVAEIANRMADEGQKVSPMAIWSEVHTGSVVAVAASLRKWREERAPRLQQVVERPALPEAVTDTMRDALDRLWTSAQDEAERAVARRLQSMRERVEDACAERDNALEELQTTVQELDALQVELDKMTRAYETKADAGSGLEEDIASAMQRADAAEKRAEELAGRVATLEAELERAVAELAAEREAHASQAAEAEAAAAAAAAGEQAGSAALTGNDEAERAALEAAHAEAVAKLEGELEAIRAALQAEQEAHAAQREQAAGAQAERDAAATELQNAQQQLASLSDERTADASEIARLTASLTEAQERADAAQQRATELAELGEYASAAASSEAAEGAAEAQPGAADPEEVEALKAQLASETARHAAAMTDARENIKRWSEYANGLKQQLAQANEKAIVGLARSAGEASLSRRLAAELGQVVPEHELLRKESQQQVVVEAVSAHLEQQGYAYDAKTGMVTKLNTENAPA